jgi:hypothetical protein
VNYNKVEGFVIGFTGWVVGTVGFYALTQGKWWEGGGELLIAVGLMTLARWILTWE